MSTRRLHIALPGLPKIGLYVSLLLLPGGFIGLLLVCWMEHRKAQGKARMWYSQMRGWRDLVPGIWSLISARPRLNAQAALRPALFIKGKLNRRLVGQNRGPRNFRHLLECRHDAEGVC